MTVTAFSASRVPEPKSACRVPDAALITDLSGIQPRIELELVNRPLPDLADPSIRALPIAALALAMALLERSGSGH